MKYTMPAKRLGIKNLDMKIKCLLWKISNSLSRRATTPPRASTHGVPTRGFTFEKKVLVFEINPHYMEIFANRPLPHRPLPASLPAAPPWLPVATPFRRSVPLSLSRRCSSSLSPTAAAAAP